MLLFLCPYKRCFFFSDLFLLSFFTGNVSDHEVIKRPGYSCIVPDKSAVISSKSKVGSDNLHSPWYLPGLGGFCLVWIYLYAIL